MQKKEYKISINAPREKVWKTLWDDATYRKWTAVFSEGSNAQSPDTDWKKGSKILFVDAKGEGMVSRIADVRKNEYMSFEHLGVIKDGVEDTSGNEWSGALENYTLKGEGGKTELSVDIDLTDEFVDFFEKTWPQAMNKVKELAERN